DAALGFRAAGAEEVDVEGATGAAELRQAGAALSVITGLDVEYTQPVAVEGHRLAGPLEGAPRSPGVVERGLDRGEAQLHQLTGGVVDVNEQRADGSAVFEPGVRRAVDLDEFPGTRPARPGRVAAASALDPRQPEPGGDEPAAQRLDGQD